MLRSGYKRALGRRISIWEAVRITLEFLPSVRVWFFSLLLLYPTLVLAQDCRIPINFTISSGTITPAVGAPFNNKALACVNWQMNVFASGVSAQSIQLESASDLGGNTPGSFALFTGTLLSGSNPSTTTTQSTTTFTGMFPWLRVNPTTATGTGNIVGVVYGFKATSSSINPVFGGGGCSAILVAPGTCLPPSSSSLTSRNLLHTILGTNFYGGSESLVVPEGNITGDPARLIGRETSTIPATPFSVTVAFLTDGLFDNAGAPGFEFGIYFRDATDKAQAYAYSYSASPSYGTDNIHFNPTSADAVSVVNPTGNNSSDDEVSAYPHWMMVIDDGVNFNVCRSRDGTHFYKVHGWSEAVGAFIGAIATMGYYVSTRNGNFTMSATVLSFNVKSGTAAISATTTVCTA